MVNFGQFGHDDMRNRRLIYNDTYVLLSIERLNDMMYEAESVQSERIQNVSLYTNSAGESILRGDRRVY